MNSRTPRASPCAPPHGLPRSLIHLASLAGLVIISLSLSFAAQAQSTRAITGNFTNASSASDWTISSAPRVTSPMDGSGWLQLLSANDRGAVGKLQAKPAIPANSPIHLEFDTVTWGGGRYVDDGLAIYFFDPKVPFASEGGFSGGGMGYCGMKGAYLGIGIDSYGNFARPRCGYTSAALSPSGLPGGLRGNSVTVRGPQTNVAATSYAFVTNVSLNGIVDPICYECTDRNQAVAKTLRRVVLDMEPRKAPEVGYVLNMTINGRSVLKDVVFPHAAPAELGLGLMAATGSASAVHEVRNVTVTTAPPACLNGVNPQTGRCLPAENALKYSDIYANVGSYGGRAPAELVDGDLAQPGWNGATAYNGTNARLAPGDCIQLGPQLPGTVAIEQIVVVSRQDDWQHAVDPTPDMEFTKHGAVDFEVSYSTDNATNWDYVPDGIVTGNNKVMRVFDLISPEKLTNLSVLICKTADDNTSPLVEILLREKK